MQDIEELKKKFGAFFDGILECGQINYPVYSLIFDQVLNVIDEAYNMGKKKGAEEK